MTWTNPETPLTHVRIIRYDDATTCSATNPEPGQNYYENLDTHAAPGAQHWSDTGVQDNIDYCYAIFGVNISDFSPGTIISGQSTDALAPSSVSVFSATSQSEGNTIRLEWTNPVDDDFDHCVIVRKAGIAPSSRNDGAQLYSGSATIYLDTGLDDGVHYYYAALIL